MEPVARNLEAEVIVHQRRGNAIGVGGAAREASKSCPQVHCATPEEQKPHYQVRTVQSPSFAASNDKVKTPQERR